MAVCPHCKGEVTKDNVEVEEVVKIKPFKMRNFMFICPHCESVLGFASNF
jgi:uncharacterized protein with PIN domain